MSKNLKSPAPHKQDNGLDRTHKAMAVRMQRDNDRDAEHNTATLTQSRDADERAHFHAAETKDIEPSQSVKRAYEREKPLNEKQRKTGSNQREGQLSNAEYERYERNANARPDLDRDFGKPPRDPDEVE